MSTYIVLVGSIGDGFKVHGPFNSFEAADRWVQGHTPTQTWEIIECHSPHHERHKEKGS